jgi:hypothetical protein
LSLAGNVEKKNKQTFVGNQTVTCCFFTWGFGLVVRAAGWHANFSGSILGRDGLYTF